MPADLKNVSMLARDTMHLIEPRALVEEGKTVSFAPVVAASLDTVLDLPQVADPLETDQV